MVNFGNLEPEEVAACHFQNESGFYFLIEEPPPEAPAPRKKAPPVTTTAPTVEVLADAVPASAPAEILSSIALPGLDGGVPQVQALAGAPADLQAVLPKGADANGFTVLLALVAVGGGAAAWKFYSQYTKQKHEQEMARIERQGQQEDSHKKCDAARAALETRLNEAQARLEAANIRLEALQQAVSSLQNAPAPKVTEFDSSELEDRLSKLEKAAKKGRK